MSGNTLGLLFSVTTFGKSHGPAIGAVIDGCPPGMTLSAEDIQPGLDRRKPGTSHHVTQRKKEDLVETPPGVYESKITGAPICSLIRNTDQRSKDYSNIVEIFRPGHANYMHWHKYDIRDPHGGGRSSARLTAPTVATGAVAKKWLREKFGIEIHDFMSQLGDIQIPFMDWNKVPNNPFLAPDAEVAPELETYMNVLCKDGDSVGTRIEVVATSMPVGWGEPLFDHLGTDIACAMMGPNAVKGVEIGAGSHTVSQRGSEHGGELTPEGSVGNNASGILGGISTGQGISVSLAIKPTSSIRTPRRSIDKAGNPAVVETLGRHNPCVGIRATPIVEALLVIVLIDHALRHRAQCGDVSVETPAIATKVS